MTQETPDGAPVVPALIIEPAPLVVIPVQLYGQLYEVTQPDGAAFSSFGRKLQELQQHMASEDYTADSVAAILTDLLSVGMDRADVAAILARVGDPADKLDAFGVGELLINLSIVWTKATLDVQDERLGRLQEMTENSGLKERMEARQEQRAAALPPVPANRAAARHPKKATAAKKAAPRRRA